MKNKIENLETFNFFYSKYFHKTEFLIKKYFINCKSESKKFTFSKNTLSEYYEAFYDNFMENAKFSKLLINNQNYYHICTINGNEKVLNIKLKQEFSEIYGDDNYRSFIIEFGIIRGINDSFELYFKNNDLFEMMYKLNDFSEFELIDYDDELVDLTLYKSLYDKLNPTNELENIDSTETTKGDLLTTTQKILLIEKLMNYNNWSNVSDRKKADVLSKITETSPENIRKTLGKLNNKISENTESFNNDITLIEQLINSLG